MCFFQCEPVDAKSRSSVCFGFLTMPPRSKPTKIEWSRCTICDCLFSSKDQDTHHKICGHQDGIQRITHGFVKNCILYASTVKHSDGM